MGRFRGINSIFNDTRKGVDDAIGTNFSDTQMFLNTSRDNGGTTVNYKNTETGEHTGENLSTGDTFSHNDNDDDDDD